MSTINYGVNFLLHRKGKNGMFYLQNECNICKWKGDRWHAYDDYQHHNCREERQNHKCKSK